MHLTLVLQVAGPDPQLFFREGDRVELPDHKVLLFLGTDLCQLASPPVAAAVVERAQPVSLRGGGGGGEWNGTLSNTSKQYHENKTFIEFLELYVILTRFRYPN